MNIVVRPIRAEDFAPVLQINAESTPGVARLDAAELQRLAALASFAWVAVVADRVAGYLLCLSSFSGYEGEEFGFFLGRKGAPFLYIDQVAVRADARRANIASQMYACLLQQGHKLAVPELCCEVNLRPENPASLRFHQKLGFERVHEMETADGRRVALMCRKTAPEKQKQAVAVVLRDDAECRELDAFLVDRIHEFNSQATGYHDGRLLGLSIQDEAGEVIAGCSGHTWGGCCEISNLWVSEPCRGRGLGASLLHAAEAEAVRRGCRQVVLLTHSFQAPAFYARHGYDQKFAIEDRPWGHSDIVLVKLLGEARGT